LSAKRMEQKERVIAAKQVDILMRDTMKFLTLI